MKANFIFGYANPPKRLTLAQMENQATWKNIHPEIKRRILALLNDCPYDLGIGNSWRSSAQQKSTFLSRYTTSKVSNTSVTYNGKKYYLKPGMAPAAPPERSYHEGTVDGYSVAVDFYNANPAINWVKANCKRYGMKYVMHGDKLIEPWHYQPVEFPDSRSTYNSNPARYKLQTFKLPKEGGGGTAQPVEPKPPVSGGKTTLPAPPPTLKVDSDNTDNVRWLQQLMEDVGWHTGDVDGLFGEQTRQSVIRMQQAVGATPLDGVYGPQTAAKLAAWLDANNVAPKPPVVTPPVNPKPPTVTPKLKEVPQGMPWPATRYPEWTTWLQTIFKERGWVFAGWDGVIDGNWDASFQAAVAFVQKEFNMNKKDGVWWPETATAIYNWLQLQGD